MELLVAGLVGVLVGAAAATGSVLLVLRRQGDRDLIERRLRACSQYRDCLGDLARVLDLRGGDAAVVEQAWKNVADFCHEYRLSSWLFEERQRTGLDALVEELEVAEALYRTNGYNGDGGTTQILTSKYREVDFLLGRELERQSRNFHSFRLLGGRRPDSNSGQFLVALVLTVPLAVVVSSALPLVADDDTEPDDEATVATGLTEGELAKRVELLKDWVYEPVALRGDTLSLLFDRADSSFYLQDQRTAVRWYSSWGRRGFASILWSGPDAPATDAPRWMLLDHVEQLVATDKRIRFEAHSRALAGPRVHLTLELLGGRGGLALRCDVPSDLANRVHRVRLLENAFWIGDAEAQASETVAGAVIPQGEGEWLRVSGPLETRRFGPARDSRVGGGGSVTALPAGRDAKEEGAAALSLPFLALAKAENVLKVSWSLRPPVVEVVRDEIAGDFFPGRTGVFFSVEFPGAAPAELRFASLGRAELGFVAAARAHREGTNREALSSLRFKCGKRTALRSFPSAPILRASVDTPARRLVVAKLVSRLSTTLELDHAVLTLSDWRRAPASAVVKESVDPKEGGEEDIHLAELVARIKKSGYLLGLELNVDGALEEGVETLPDQEAESLLQTFAPDLLLLQPTGAATVPASLCQALNDEFGLVGLVAPPVDAIVGPAHLSSLAYLGGFVEPSAWTGPERIAWPLFNATFGHSVRMGVPRGKALGPDDMNGFLVHLLLGETPAYDVEALTLPGEMSALASPFAVDEGWTAGKGLSAAERFLKNTTEVTSHLSAWRYRLPLLFHRALTDDGSVRETYYGPDLRVLINFGPGDYEEDDLVLPPQGFLVKYPFFLAFYAKRMHGLDYERPAFFTVRSLEGKMYLRAKRVRLYHGFGPNRVRLGGKTFEVDRESEVKIW